MLDRSLLGGSAFAGTVTGQVVNGTTSKPAAGDEVVILALSQGMTEIGRTKTDASGNFKINIPDDGTPHMVRVNHDGVNYFPKGGPLMPGATSATIQVYDAAKKLAVSTTVNVMRVQADTSTLQATELFAVQNASQPARTLFDPDKTYEFTLPDGAVIDSAAARTQDGQPVNSAAPFRKKRRTTTPSSSRCVPARPSSRSPTTCPTKARPASRPSHSPPCSTSSSCFPSR